MAELLRLDSTRLYGNSNQGRACGFFHIFDAYQNRENKRMLSYQRLGGRQHGMGTDILLETDEAGSGGYTMADKGSINIVENKAHNMNKSSGILNFIGNKLLKRQKHKGKMSHSPTQLTCTTHIHPSESSDYVTPGELGQMTSDRETSTISLCLDESNSLAMSEHESLIVNGIHGSVEGKQRAHEALNTTGYDVGSLSHNLNEMGNHLLDEHIILKEKLFEARCALLKQKDLDPKGMTAEFLLQSKIFLDTLHLFNTNREALYNVCRGQNSFVANAIQTSVSPAKPRASNRSVSLTVLELSRNAAGIPVPSRKQIECDEFINQGSESGSVDLLINTFGVVPNIEVLPGSYHELRKQGVSNTILSRLRQLKQKLKGVIVENKKQHRRISMDRILDKVPSGKKLPEDEEGDKLHLKDGHVSRGGQGFKFNRVAPGSSIEKFANNGIRRSRSLTESLDRYSQLLDYISSNEVRKVPERSNSIQELSGLLHTKLPKVHRRMPSNPEFLSTYSFIKEVRSDESIAFQSSKKLTLEPLDSYLAPTANCSDKLNKDLVMQLAAEEIACEHERSLESIIDINAVKANVSDEFVAPTVETSITESKGHERYSCSIYECQIVPFQFSKSFKEKNDLFNGQGPQIGDEPDVKPEKTSPISVLDTDIEEPVSPLKFTVMAGSDMQQLQENLEQLLPCTKAWNDVEFNELNIAELSKPNFNEEIGTISGDEASCFHTHDDNKDAARFNYIRHILSKSGYEALLCETVDSSIEVDASSHMLCGKLFEEQLTYDLINDVLLEIYEHYTVPSPWLSCFHSKIRSMPTGSCLVEEVWSEIRWHLSSPQGLDTMVDKILARNFAKTDGWMNLYRDAECFGLLLEQLILDDLVDEVILDIDE